MQRQESEINVLSIYEFLKLMGLVKIFYACNGTFKNKRA